jgi:hypothetical protein
MAILTHITTCGELISATLGETIAEACHPRAVYLRRGAVGGRTKRMVFQAYEEHGLLGWADLWICLSEGSVFFRAAQG